MMRWYLILAPKFETFPTPTNQFTERPLTSHMTKIAFRLANVGQKACPVASGRNFCSLWQYFCLCAALHRLQVAGEGQNYLFTGLWTYPCGESYILVWNPSQYLAIIRNCTWKKSIHVFIPSLSQQIHQSYFRHCSPFLLNFPTPVKNLQKSLVLRLKTVRVSMDQL